MRIKLLRSPAAALGCRIAEGESGEIDDAIGRQLVSLGIAIEIEQPKPAPVVRAVPDEPAIAESKAPEIAPAKTEVKAEQKPRKQPVLNAPTKHKEK